MLRKFISALLAVVIVTSTFTTMTVSATEQSPVSLSNNDVSVQGENSFGDMLSGKIEDAMAQETTSADFALSGLKIEDKTATVEYMSAVDCTILVALYDEATNKMLASGKSVVSSEEDVATITIETEEMPKYFVATAYMIDSNNAPLTDEFTTELYTEEIQMVKAMKATDFEEDRVLKLEDTDETNFAVYSEDTKVIEYKENYNIPVTIDDENGVYVFSNANDELKTLVKGDMLAYEHSADNIIILKVDTIKIDGDTVTITEGDVELEDVFDYVKIEASLDEGECEVNMDGIDDGIQLVDKPSSVSSKAPSSVGAIDEEVSYFHETSFKFLDVSCIFGEIKFGITSTLNVYISLDKADIDFTVEYSLVGTVGLEATTEEIELPFAEIKIPLAPAVVLTIVPAVVFEAKASVGLEIEIKGTAGFKATKKGVKLKDLSLETDSSLKIQGEVFFGLQFEPSLDILDKDIASAGIPITAGMRFQAVNKEYEANHLCVLCFEGEASEELYVSAEIKLTKKRLLSEKTGIKRKLFDFYFSTDFLDTGKGKCPHSEYPIDIYVTKDGKPYSSAEVWIYDGGTYAKMEGITDSNGKLTVTLPYGLYTADVDGELVSFLSHKSTEKVEINVVGATEPTTEPTTTQPTEPETEPTEPEETKPYIIDSGVCGDNATWELWSTGELSILGTGAMYNYSPWGSKYVKSITSVTINNGITSIGEYTFSSHSNLANVTIPESVTVINRDAFGYCTSLTSIEIPDSVTYIGAYAFMSCSKLEKVKLSNRIGTINNSTFRNCSSLSDIIIPKSVRTIGEMAFYCCSSLKSLTLPKNVSSVDSHAFAATGMTSLIVYGNPSFHPYTFGWGVGLGYVEKIIQYVTEQEENSVSTSYTTNSLINNSSANVAEFDNLIAGGDYIVAVVKSEETEDLLSADNLLYIEQVTADENGNVSLDYVPRESVDNSVALIFGADRMSISDAEVTALKDEGSQAVEYTVTLNGAVLTENTDYELVADDESVTINGINNYKDSITLTIVPMLIGDVNQDNMININDTTYIMKYLAELESFNDTQKLVADTNGDGAVTITDATQIQKYLASLITSFN